MLKDKKKCRRIKRLLHANRQGELSKFFENIMKKRKKKEVLPFFCLYTGFKELFLLAIFMLCRKLCVTLRESKWNAKIKRTNQTPGVDYNVTS
jgi:ATP/ADP translocase